MIVGIVLAYVLIGIGLWTAIWFLTEGGLTAPFDQIMVVVGSILWPLTLLAFGLAGCVVAVGLLFFMGRSKP